MSFQVGFDDRVADCLAVNGGGACRPAAGPGLGIASRCFRTVTDGLLCLGAGPPSRLARLHRHIRRGRLSGLTSSPTLNQLSTLKLQLRRGLNATAADGDDQSLCALRAQAELRAYRLIYLLTVFGFPLVLFATFFSDAVGRAPRDWVALPNWLLGNGDGDIHWQAVAVYAGLSITGMVLIGIGWALLRGLERLLGGGKTRHKP